jgi:hypothetical protein
VLQSLGECELNLMSRDYLSTTAAACHFKTLALKMIIIILSSLEGLGDIPFIVVLICAALITWMMITEVRCFSAAQLGVDNWPTTLTRTCLMHWPATYLWQCVTCG